MRLFVGTYGAAVHELAFDPAAGRLAAVGRVAGPGNPSFLAFHPRLPVLYSVDELQVFEGGFGGGVSAYRIGGEGLALLGSRATHGTDPCHLAVVDGRVLVVANYTSGHVTVLPLAGDGRVGAAGQVVERHGRSVDPRRQAGPHAHHVALIDGRVVVSDLGTDELVVFRLVGEALVADGAAVATSPGGGPRRVVCHPGGQWAYVLNEMQATITRYRVDFAAGWERAETVDMLPSGWDGARSGAEFAFGAGGRFLYASNRGHDSIAVFAVDGGSGVLSAVGHVATGGAKPRHFEISPCGAWLAVANQGSDEVAMFRIDPDHGMPAPTGWAIAVEKPACVRFLPG